MIQNNNADGLWIPANGEPEGIARRLTNHDRLLNRVGYAALGRNDEWLAVHSNTNDHGTHNTFRDGHCSAHVTAASWTGIGYPEREDARISPRLADLRFKANPRFRLAKPNF